MRWIGRKRVEEAGLRTVSNGLCLFAGTEFLFDSREAASYF